MLAEAFALHQAGQLADAESSYKKILETEPDHFDCLHLLGVIFSQRGDHAAALQQIDAALKRNPTNALALNNRGNALNGLKRFEEALASYDRALAVRPDLAEAVCNRGVALHELKRFEDSLAAYDRALTVRPDYAEALANRGNTLAALKRFEQALASYDSALALRPDYAQAHFRRGNSLYELQRFEEALSSYDRALALRPDYAEAYCCRGGALHALEQFEEALASYDRALELQPDYAEALANRGLALHHLKQFGQALTSYDQALKLRPDFAEALSNRGLTMHELRRFEQALASYDRALTLRPDYTVAYHNRGNALYELRRFEQALASYDRALTQRPDYAEAHCGRGNALHALERFEQALASYDRALKVRSNYAEAFSNRGLTLHELRRFEEALASYDRALTLRPAYAEALCNRGVTLQELKRFEEALASYDRAIKVRPNDGQAHYNEAICRMLIGDFARGWEKYEWRWETEQLAKAKRNFSQPLWIGSGEIAGKTILIHAEQGLGDTIQFCRYVPLVARQASRVILEIQRPLRELMSTLASAAQIVPRGDPLPDFDIHCPLLSLPLALKTGLDTIPSETPYLSALESKINVWRDRLGRRERTRIGIVWAGNPRKELSAGHRILDRQRSIEFNRLAPVFQVPNCDFYSLQKGDDAVLQLRDSPLCHRVIDWTRNLHDFSDTAALIENLDLVITVDTSVAHLAGALGKSFWLINRYNTCWRWLLDREDSPWYPTGRLFRQDHTRDWDSVIARVQAALDDYVRSASL
jgi:tetratricopeptide (TPR) repeat protein